MLKPNNQASQRTKNRLRENPNHEIVSVSKSVPALADQPGILIRSLESDFFGWIPRSEVNIEPEREGE